MNQRLITKTGQCPWNEMTGLLRILLDDAKALDKFLVIITVKINMVSSFIEWEKIGSGLIKAWNLFY